MKIFIDIGHPAHVHYFRNFINIMKKKGHEFIVTARDKEVVFDLLNYYHIKYINRGKGGKSLFNKLLYIPKADLLLYKVARDFKPDIFLSFGSAYASHIAYLTGKPHIAFDDTDHAAFEHLLYVPFTETIITPKAYLKNFGKKHIRINSYMELCSTHPAYFSPEEKILDELDLGNHKAFVVIRLVSWNASHDIGLKGLSIKGLEKIINILKGKYKIIISSENKLPKNLQEYAYNIHPTKIHNTLYYADLFIGESLTMAIESASLGTPSFAITSAKAGVTEEQISNGLLKKYDNENELFIEIEKMLINENYKRDFQLKAKEILNKKINVTTFMIWFIENYPKSKNIMMANPNYQNNFI